MRNLLIVSLIVIATSVFADPPHVDTVSTTSIKIIPEQGIDNAPAWVGATNTYAQGEVVKSGANYYFAISGGISTNLAPVHSLGAGDATRDGVTWRCFNPRKRKGMVLVNIATNAISLALDYPAVAGSGIVLSANGGAFSLADSFQGAVYADTTVDGSLSSITW